MYSTCNEESWDNDEICSACKVQIKNPQDYGGILNMFLELKTTFFYSMYSINT